MNLVPLHDNIILEEIEVSNTTKSGLYIPDSAKEKPSQGKVVAVGRGRVLPNGAFVETTLKPGELVIFQKYAGTEIKIEGQKYLIIKEENILVKLD